MQDLDVLLARLRRCHVDGGVVRSGIQHPHPGFDDHPQGNPSGPDGDPSGPDGDSLSRRFADEVAINVIDDCGPLPPGVAIIAQGGLARRQLVYGADIDLLFLIDDGLEAPQGTTADGVPDEAAIGPVDIGAAVARMWDRGLKVSWAVRRPSELRALFDDVDGKAGHAAMALLEARALAGDLDFARHTLTTIRRGLGPERRRRLLRARLSEALRRRNRFHHSPALVEPNLKEGPGGLRDIHLLSWAALCLSGLDLAVRPMSAVMSSLGDDDVGDPYAALLAAGTLYPSEVTAVIACRRELQVLRWALALSSGGTEQRLHAAAAEAAAALLPEAFFHDVDDREEHIPLRPGEMVVRRATRAMRRCLVAVDDALHRLGAPDLPLPARRETHPNDAAGLFSLMSQAEQSSVPGPLTALLERGILQRMVPDLARLEGRVKHDGIHAFCTDAHLVRCGDIALGIVGGNDENLLGPLALPPPLLPVLRRLERPAVVVASALYHDIGKGLPGDHSLVGEEIVRRDLPGLGFADDDIDEVAFLVRHHLLLSMTAQRADLGDPRVVDGITAIVDTPEQLDALAVLTWCDWCAVGPGIATAWKGRLLADCVEAVREALLQPEKRARDQNAIRDRARRYLEPLSTIVAPAVMEAFVVDASASWLRGRTKEALQHDLRAFANLGARKPPLGLEHSGRPEGAFVDASQTVPQRAWVLVPDRAGLLADLAAAFASEGINVLDARLDVRANSDAFDCFVFDDGRGGLVPPDICRLLQVALEEAIAGQTRNVTKRRVSIPVSPRVRFLDGTNDQHFIVEVRCANRRGLLHDLARVFSAHELSITLARLHTEGQRVTDVFTAHPPPNFEDQKTSSGDPAATVEALRASLRTNLLVVAGG